MRKIAKVHSENLESSFGRLGKFVNLIWKIRNEIGSLGKLGKKSDRFHWEIRKIQPNRERSFGRLGILGKFIRMIRKVHSED